MIVIIMSVLLNNTLAKCYMKKRVDDTHPNNEILTMLYLNISDSICFVVLLLFIQLFLKMLMKHLCIYFVKICLL